MLDTKDSIRLCIVLDKKTNKRLRAALSLQDETVSRFVRKAINDKLDWEEALAKKGKK